MPPVRSSQNSPAGVAEFAGAFAGSGFLLVIRLSYMHGFKW
jgi:hypothetical protein